MVDSCTFNFCRVNRRGADENTWQLDGELTIIGQARPVTWDVEFHGATRDPWGGTRAAFSASTEVNREDWGLSWNAPLGPPRGP